MTTASASADAHAPQMVSVSLEGERKAKNGEGGNDRRYPAMPSEQRRRAKTSDEPKVNQEDHKLNNCASARSASRDHPDKDGETTGPERSPEDLRTRRATTSVVQTHPQNRPTRLRA